MSDGRRSKQKSTCSCITHLELIDQALKEEKCTLNTQETIEKNTHNILEGFFVFSPSYDVFDAPTPLSSLSKWVNPQGKVATLAIFWGYIQGARKKKCVECWMF